MESSRWSGSVEVKSDAWTEKSLIVKPAAFSEKSLSARPTRSETSYGLRSSKWSEKSSALGISSATSQKSRLTRATWVTGRSARTYQGTETTMLVGASRPSVSSRSSKKGEGSGSKITEHAGKDDHEQTETTENKPSIGSKKSAAKTKKSIKKKSAVDQKPKDKKSVVSDPETGPRKSRGSKKGSRASSKDKKGKKGKPKKEKPKKLNRKAIYKDLKLIEKKMQDEGKLRQRMGWEKNKLFFYWNCIVGKLIDLNKRNHQLKKKQESLRLEKKHAMFHEHWKNMNEARMNREEALDAKRAEFRSMITKLRDTQKSMTDWLFKDIQTYVKDTYLVGQKYMSDIVGIRMEYTKGLTDTLFDARENLRVLEIEQNYKYGPAMDEFEEEMRRLRSRIPKERQERLRHMLTESNAQLVELVNVYTNILHHNFIEVCHTANIINDLKSRERRLEREMNELAKKRNKIKERTEYLHDRVSTMRRQVNAGKEARKKLHKVMKDQDLLQNMKDIAYINKEIIYQENAKLSKDYQEMSDKVDQWYFKVKREFLKTIIVEAGKYKERALQLTNYNRLVKHLFEVEEGFLENVEFFKDHEEYEDPKQGLKVLLGVFRPLTLEDLEKEFEGCTESFSTAIIFFKRRLHQNYLSLDDLHFFIKRRSPLSYLDTALKEERSILNALSYSRTKKRSLYHSTHTPGTGSGYSNTGSASAQSFTL